jgi:hypothetical protein
MTNTNIPAQATVLLIYRGNMTDWLLIYLTSSELYFCYIQHENKFNNIQQEPTEVNF